METCVCFKASGHRCEKVPTNGNSRCTVHHRSHQRHIAQCGPLPEGRCATVVTRQRRKTWCPHAHVPGTCVCQHHLQAHANARLRDEQRKQDQLDINTAVFVFEGRGLPWRDVVEETLAWDDDHAFVHLRLPIAQVYFSRNTQLPLAHFGNYWRWVAGGRVGPDPTVEPPRLTRRTLAQLALDPQSVHTNEVVVQTNKSLTILLNANRDDGCNFMEWLAGHWLARGIANWSRVRSTVDDMQKWYTRDTCVNPGDKLYRRALDGLGALLIEHADNKDEFGELLKRTFEECHESIGMCCEGHMGRLSNVMVGFDDRFAPPIPTGELLQQKMGAIAMLDVDTDEKVRQATAVMDELNIPEPERAVWIDAF